MSTVGSGVFFDWWMVLNKTRQAQSNYEKRAPGNDQDPCNELCPSAISERDSTENMIFGYQSFPIICCVNLNVFREGLCTWPYSNSFYHPKRQDWISGLPNYIPVNSFNFGQDLRILELGFLQFGHQISKARHELNILKIKCLKLLILSSTVYSHSRQVACTFPIDSTQN